MVSLECKSTRNMAAARAYHCRYSANMMMGVGRSISTSRAEPRNSNEWHIINLYSGAIIGVDSLIHAMRFLVCREDC